MPFATRRSRIDHLCQELPAVGTLRGPAGSNRSIIPSARNCYLCLRN